MAKARQNKNKQANNVSNQQRKRRIVQPPRYGSILPTRNNINYGIARFSRVTDPLVVSAFTNPPVVMFPTTDAGGGYSATMCLSPLGITGWDAVASVKKQVESPHLPWLYNTSRNFGSYRIVSANLVFVGNLGSNTQGSIVVHSSRDYSDKSVNDGIIGAGGTMFDISTMGTKNKVIPLQLDNTWKKVTSETTTVSGTTLVSANSINDLIFTSFTMRINSAPASIAVCTMYVEYDVEFANPMSTGYNG